MPYPVQESKDGRQDQLTEEHFEALRGCVELIELWMNGIFAKMGVTWASEEDWPPALREAKRVLRKAKI